MGENILSCCPCLKAPLLRSASALPASKQSSQTCRLLVACVMLLTGPCQMWAPAHHPPRALECGWEHWQRNEHANIFTPAQPLVGSCLSITRMCQNSIKGESDTRGRFLQKLNASRLWSRTHPIVGRLGLSQHEHFSPAAHPASGNYLGGPPSPQCPPCPLCRSCP